MDVWNEVEICILTTDTDDDDATFSLLSTVLSSPSSLFSSSSLSLVSTSMTSPPRIRRIVKNTSLERRCRCASKVPLLHPSTDRVFDNTDDGENKDDDNDDDDDDASMIDSIVKQHSSNNNIVWSKVRWDCTLAGDF
jgi:hypothetical protein